MRGLLVVLLAGLWLTAAASENYPEHPQGDDHVVILVYHHVATDTPASTSVTPDSFARQLDWLEDNDYRVLSLDEVLWRLAKGKRFPPNSVAFTFDDAYDSVYETAWPMLRERDWPFAVFVSTAYIDDGYANYMTWRQLADLSADGVLIGNHGVHHASALARGDRSKSDWLAAFEADALEAAERIREETGVVPRVYAWPYGEYNDDVEQVVADLGWYALGQQSGPAGHDASLTAVPRFPVASAYARPDAFAQRLKSEPLPVQPRNPPERLRDTHAAPTLQLYLDDPRYNLSQVSCFDAGGRRLEIDSRGEHSIAVRSTEPLPAGRSKYTCTAPRKGRDGVYGWYSHLWVVGAEGE